MTQIPDNILSLFISSPENFICTTLSTTNQTCTTKPTTTETPVATTADHHLVVEDETMITSNNRPSQGSRIEEEGAVEGEVEAEEEEGAAEATSTTEG